ncbi:hypothetical protein [Paracidovorax valerianellae]|uniref:Argininosuccinate lyase n=1 Tax=Paracidovorax valerianellae TaxID=187868 RepID=A0A1G6T5F1_9BURK|nr:hypothetical protein [Paracidovorax valerianellae]MDA8445507.1 hypothetical protein [Paracidovorax valerianellae]SDD24288.1 hypothetical protein SAMN05192589_10568 [Paracidovorax valerianellae]
MFKKILVLGCLALSGASFAADADFTLVNRTGYALNEVYISPTKMDKWGSDRLGRNQLVNGASRKFKFGDTKHCVQDIKVVFTDDSSEVEWEGFNLCELDKITLKYNRKTGDVSAETE